MFIRAHKEGTVLSLFGGEEINDVWRGQPPEEKGMRVRRASREECLQDEMSWSFQKGKQKKKGFARIRQDQASDAGGNGSHLQKRGK